MQQIFVKLNTAGSDTGPFMIYSNVDGYITAYGINISKAALTAGVNVNVPDFTTSVKIRSNGKCTNSIIVNVDPPVRLIKVSPTNRNDFFGSLIQKITGTNPDNLTFDMTLVRYNGSNCTGTSFSYPVIDTLNASQVSKFKQVVSQFPIYVSGKISSLSVNGIQITTSPQTITVNGNEYIIEGYNVCTPL